MSQRKKKNNNNLREIVGVAMGGLLDVVSSRCLSFARQAGSVSLLTSSCHAFSARPGASRDLMCGRGGNFLQARLDADSRF